MKLFKLTLIFIAPLFVFFFVPKLTVFPDILLDSFIAMMWCAQHIANKGEKRNG